MSTFVVFESNLYADSLELILLHPIQEIITSKINISPDRQFCFCCSGHGINERKDQLTKLFRTVIEKMIISKRDTSDIKDLIGGPLDNDLSDVITDALIATKTHIFMISGNVVDNKHTVGNATGHPLVCKGSSKRILCGLVMGGVHPRDAYKILNNYDHGTGAVPEEFDLLSLEDFVVTGQKTEG